MAARWGCPRVAGTQPDVRSRQQAHSMGFSPVPGLHDDVLELTCIRRHENSCPACCPQARFAMWLVLA